MPLRPVDARERPLLRSNGDSLSYRFDEPPDLDAVNIEGLLSVERPADVPRPDLPRLDLRRRDEPELAPVRLLDADRPRELDDLRDEPDLEELDLLLAMM